MPGVGALLDARLGGMIPSSTAGSAVFALTHADDVKDIGATVALLAVVVIVLIIMAVGLVSIAQKQAAIREQVKRDYGIVLTTAHSEFLMDDLDGEWRTLRVEHERTLRYDPVTRRVLMQKHPLDLASEMAKTQSRVEASS